MVPAGGDAQWRSSRSPSAFNARKVESLVTWLYISIVTAIWLWRSICMATRVWTSRATSKDAQALRVACTVVVARRPVYTGPGKRGRSFGIDRLAKFGRDHQTRLVPCLSLGPESPLEFEPTLQSANADFGKRQGRIGCRRLGLPPKQAARDTLQLPGDQGLAGFEINF